MSTSHHATVTFLDPVTGRAAPAPQPKTPTPRPRGVWVGVAAFAALLLLGGVVLRQPRPNPLLEGLTSVPSSEAWSVANETLVVNTRPLLEETLPARPLFTVIDTDTLPSDWFVLREQLGIDPAWLHGDETLRYVQRLSLIPPNGVPTVFLTLEATIVPEGEELRLVPELPAGEAVLVRGVEGVTWDRSVAWIDDESAVMTARWDAAGLPPDEGLALTLDALEPAVFDRVTSFAMTTPPRGEWLPTSPIAITSERRGSDTWRLDHAGILDLRGVRYDSGFDPEDVALDIEAFITSDEDRQIVAGVAPSEVVAVHIERGGVVLARLPLVDSLVQPENHLFALELLADSSPITLRFVDEDGDARHSFMVPASIGPLTSHSVVLE